MLYKYLILAGLIFIATSSKSQIQAQVFCTPEGKFSGAIIQPLGPLPQVLSIEELNKFCQESTKEKPAPSTPKKSQPIKSDSSKMSV